MSYMTAQVTLRRTTAGSLAALQHQDLTNEIKDGVLGPSPLLNRLRFDLKYGNGVCSSFLVNQYDTYT